MRTYSFRSTPCHAVFVLPCRLNFYIVILYCMYILKPISHQHICMYIHTHNYMYIHTRVHVHVCVLAQEHTWIHAHMHTCVRDIQVHSMYPHTRWHMHTYVPTWTCTCVSTCPGMHVCMHAMCTCTYTCRFHINTYTCM